jgi:hypothetical protein
MKYWPLKNQQPMFPDEPGRFGTRRKHDYHTGVDLYCELGQEVIAIEDGVVITVEPFTGKEAGSDWWNNTEAILIIGESGIFNYGEVTPLVKKGDKVKAGQTIAIVDAAVLKSFKGRPMVMLHLELLSHDTVTSPWWLIEDSKPNHIWNPEPILIEIAKDDLTYFELSKYDGERYKDSKAPEKDSEWWAVWQSASETIPRENIV